MENSPKERRMHLRVFRNFILSYHLKGGKAAAQEVSQVNNVSRGGLNFASTHAIKPGAVLSIELKTPFLVGGLLLEGVVLECKEKVADLIYEVRLQFQAVPPEALQVLEKIEKYSQSS